MTLARTGEATKVDSLATIIERLPRRLRVAVVQFWLTVYGRTERMPEAIGEIFPQADFYTLVASEQHGFGNVTGGTAL